MTGKGCQEASFNRYVRYSGASHITHQLYWICSASAKFHMMKCIQTTVEKKLKNSKTTLKTSMINDQESITCTLLGQVFMFFQV